VGYNLKMCGNDSPPLYNLIPYKNKKKCADLRVCAIGQGPVWSAMGLTLWVYHGLDSVGVR